MKNTSGTLWFSPRCAPTPAGTLLAAHVDAQGAEATEASKIEEKPGAPEASSLKGFFTRQVTGSLQTHAELGPVQGGMNVIAET